METAALAQAQMLRGHLANLRKEYEELYAQRKRTDEARRAQASQLAASRQGVSKLSRIHPRPNNTASRAQDFLNEFPHASLSSTQPCVRHLGLDIPAIQNRGEPWESSSDAR